MSRCSLARLLVALILVPLLASAAAATWVMDYSGTLSPNLHGEECDRPIALSYSARDDELCVTDAARRSLRVYSGRGIFSFATGGLAQLAQPADGLLLADGGFALIDSDRGQGRTLRRLDYRGEPLPFVAVSPLADWMPEHLLLTADGGLLSVDNAHRLLAKHDGASGALLWTRTVGDADEARERDLALGRPAEGPDGRLYLPSGILHRVLVFDGEGKALSSFGRFGSARGQFVFPTGVACGPQGLLLVLDRLRHVVLLFDGEQRFLAEYGSFGGRPGQFYHPNAIAAAADGRVFVGQGYRGRVHCFRLYDTAAEATVPSRSELLQSSIRFTTATRGCRLPALPGVGPALAEDPTRWSLSFNPTA